MKNTRSEHLSKVVAVVGIVISVLTLVSTTLNSFLTIQSDIKKLVGGDEKEESLEHA